jgi:hypothetical protein
MSPARAVPHIFLFVSLAMIDDVLPNSPRRGASSVLRSKSESESVSLRALLLLVSRRKNHEKAILICFRTCMFYQGSTTTVRTKFNLAPDYF